MALNEGLPIFCQFMEDNDIANELCISHLDWNVERKKEKQIDQV